MGLAANIVFVITVITLSAVGFYGTYYFNVGSAYTAKIACSGLKSAGRPQSSVNEEFSFIPIPIYSVNVNGNTVTASFFGFFSRTAVYDPQSNSCTLLGPGTEKLNHQKTSVLAPKPKKHEPSAPVKREGVNTEHLAAIIGAAFDEPSIPEAGFHRRSRAILISIDGEVITEQYAPGFDENTPLIGWQLTEALFSAIIGKRIDEGKLSLAATNLFPESDWAKDKRKDITLGQLLSGTSGLSITGSEFHNMLYDSDSASDYVIKTATLKQSEKPFSGASNLLSRVLRNSFASQEEYWTYVRSFLDEIGLQNTIIDTDNQGDFVASSFAYGPARDWFNFGEFIRNRGKVNGKQILSESWFDNLSSSATTGPVKGLWSNNNNQISADIPKDAIFALGDEEQSITVIPSLKLTVVRLGCTQPGTVWHLTGFITYLLQNVLTQ